MENRRINGSGSGVIKYDILTALSISGMHRTPADQISMSRLSALITARYNWRNDELTMGQREMSLLWNVGERTVKREVKRWLNTGLLICRRPGVRGRVASYRLNLNRLCELTRDVWPLIGPDFVQRMSSITPGDEKVIRLDTKRPEPLHQSKRQSWDAVMFQLANRFPVQFDAWIAPLVATEKGNKLFLDAKSAFAAEYIKTHFGRDIAEAVAAEWARPPEIVIRGNAMNCTTVNQT